MNQQEYLRLYEKYERGEASQEEINLLMSYKDDFHLEDPTYEEVTSDEYQQARERITNQLQSTIHPKRPAVRTLRWMAAAAAILVIVITVLKVGHHEGALPKETAVTGTHQNRNSAILTLANGKQLALNDIANGTVSTQGGIVVEKQQNGLLQYKIVSDNTSVVDTNTVSTPRGSEYQVVLPDGTKVWLNAASSLTFPIAFTGKERKVFLTGEAYFEVAKNKHKPFKVKFNHEEVEVLGTHFNIMAYKDEAETKATLIEGSVKVTRNNVQRLLVPGQQAVSNQSTDGLSVYEANVQDVIAWKDGYFVFRDANIETIMRQAARWYDIEVVYTGDLSKKKFGGRISKYENISELLKNLEITGTIHFKTEGKRIIVMQ